MRATPYGTVPGAAYVQTSRLPIEYGRRRTDLELVAGLQSVSLELEPACHIHFEFRVDGVAPQLSDGIGEWIRHGPMGGIRAVDHEGRALSGAEKERVVEVTAPGVYEVSFEGLTADRFHPTPPRRVSVRAGEIAGVIVELHRK